MFNTNVQYPLSNYLPVTGYWITPVGRFEEASQMHPDLRGNPSFFYDQSRNEFFVKQRKLETGEIQTLRYVLSNEPLKPIESQGTTTNYDEEIGLLKREIERLNEALAVKVKKEVKNVPERE